MLLFQDMENKSSPNHGKNILSNLGGEEEITEMQENVNTRDCVKCLNVFNGPNFQYI